MRLKLSAIVAVLLLFVCIGCIGCASFNVSAERMVSQAIDSNEKLHNRNALSDQQFKDTAKVLYDVSLAGREYTKLQMAHQTTPTETAKFVAQLSRALDTLSTAPYASKLGDVLNKLHKLQGKALGYLNAVPAQ